MILLDWNDISKWHILQNMKDSDKNGIGKIDKVTSAAIAMNLFYCNLFVHSISKLNNYHVE